MFLVNIDKQTVQVVFQDLSIESRNLDTVISRELDKSGIPVSLQRRIKQFFKDNTTINSNFERQKNFVNTLKTYIDVIDDKQGKKVYFLHIQVLPKDIKLVYDKSEGNGSLFEKIEKLSLHIFRLYNTQIDNKDVEFQGLKDFKGDSFLDLELAFYERELLRLYDHLLNYKRSLRDQVICSDKEVGVQIEQMNILEANPLKSYQFVKVAHQSDLIIFVYSLVTFLQNERLAHFKDNLAYTKLNRIVSKIYNFLQKISTARHIKQEHIILKQLPPLKILETEL